MIQCSISLLPFSVPKNRIQWRKWSDSNRNVCHRLACSWSYVSGLYRRQFVAHKLLDLYFVVGNQLLFNEIHSTIFGILLPFGIYFSFIIHFTTPSLNVINVAKIDLPKMCEPKWLELSDFFFSRLSLTLSLFLSSFNEIEFFFQQSLERSNHQICSQKVSFKFQWMFRVPIAASVYSTNENKNWGEWKENTPKNQWIIPIDWNAFIPSNVIEPVTNRARENKTLYRNFQNCLNRFIE